MALRTRQFTDQEIRYFRELVGRDDAPLRMLQRAYIVWLSAQGKRVPAIAREVGVSEHTVRVWLTRFNQLGAEGLKDLPRPGAERKYTDDHVAEICRVASARPAMFGLAFRSWTLDRLVSFLHAERGITVKRSRLNEILRAAAIGWQGCETASREHGPVQPNETPRHNARERCSQSARRPHAIPLQSVRHGAGASRDLAPAAPLG